MREIKFRGRRVDNGEWVYGFFYTFVVAEKTIASIMGIGEDTSTYMVNPETVGQYTGLKDRNGKEIYEGDFLRWEKIPEVFSLITFSDGVFWGGGSPLYDCLEEEVTGNQFEHPHLLKGEEA